ncbi:MAG: FAD-linked oxidase C-terminal domain-containing protein [Thermoanaerobaculia bacterium]
MAKTENAFARQLRREIRGDVYLDEVTRGIYATDASNYQIQPLAVAVPRDADDVRRALEIARRHRVSVLPRGAGTSLAGQAVGRSLILDFSKYMNRVLELDVKQRWVRVEPGSVRDELNAKVAEHGLHFAPDPATTSRANVGGMIGNNSSGTRSLLYGKTIDHVLELRVLLADGTELDLGPLSAAELAAKTEGDDREAEIHRGLERIVKDHADEIRRRYPKTMRRVGGYALDEFLGDVWNPAKILVGSEGTLAVVLEAKLRLEPLPRHTALAVVHFADLLEAIRAVEPILSWRPTAVEILDRTILDLARHNLATAPLCDFLVGDPEAVLIVEFYGDTADEAAAKPEAMRADLERRGLGTACPVFLDPVGQSRVWEVRKNGLGLMLGMKGDLKPLPFIEDAAVPVAVLPEYIDRVLALCRELDTGVAMYAHASVGVIHVRPILDLRRGEDIERMKAIAEATFELVMEYQGSWSSEHGDGLVRSPFNERFFGSEIYGALKDVKRLFDPENLLNPGKIVDAEPIDRNLRFGTTYQVPAIDTEYRYREDGSFAAAVEMCTGVGQCRKTLGGTMCPSYIATRDEEHSTRGRANALRLAMSGQLGPEGLTSRRLYQALELCLGCKACKAECPSNVDMAKLRGEFLQKYHDRHGASWRDRLVGSSPVLASKLAGPWAPVVNAVQAHPLFRRLVEATAGIHRERTLPAYARETFPAWFSRNPPPEPAERSRVVLFADTYLSCHEPRIGRAAVELLRSCGYEVVLAAAGCCQRPRISHGFLRRARRDGEKTLRGLDTYLRQGLPVVVCEPSCASALTDDLPDLVDDPELGRRVAGGVLPIDVFLDRELEAGRLTSGFESDAGKILIHGHCHQKALFGTAAMKRVLGRVPDLRVEEVDSGCCGMAGAFGYEREHYELSRKIGEDRLFPAIRDLDGDTAVVACGFSCRHQIEHFTGRSAVHWVEVLRAATGLKPGSADR